MMAREGSAPTAGATTADDIVIDELLAREAERRRCLVERDFAALATLFADDLTYVHSIGTVQDRTTYLGYVQGPLRFLSIERAGLQVRLYGDVALMTGAMTNTIVAPNLAQPLKVDAFVAQVWRRGARGDWQMAHFQATRPPAPDAPRPL